jgi:hypothetical protein
MLTTGQEATRRKRNTSPGRVPRTRPVTHDRWDNMGNRWLHNHNTNRQDRRNKDHRSGHGPPNACSQIDRPRPFHSTWRTHGSDRGINTCTVTRMLEELKKAEDVDSCALVDRAKLGYGEKFSESSYQTADRTATMTQADAIALLPYVGPIAYLCRHTCTELNARVI